MSSKKDPTEVSPEDLAENMEVIDIGNELPDVESEVIGFSDDAEKATEGSSGGQEDYKKLLEKAGKDYLYLRAEYDNYRRQAIKERGDLMKYSGENIARDLLDTLDILEKALSTEVTADNYQNFTKGIELTAQQLRTTLNKHGIQEVPAQGEVFNPQFHDALASAPSEDVPEGHIMQVFKKPYTYHDKVLRPGQVVVAKPKDS